jgi:hypothetical protein
MSKIANMLQLQQELNDSTNGKGWEKGITKQGKEINWRRCIYLEGAELIDSYPWKHWKNINAQPDYENIKIELVDIWHFVMSEILRVNALEHKLSLDELAFKIEEAIKDLRVQKEENFYKEIEAIEKFLAKLFCNFETIDFTKNFFEICYKLDLDFDTLYKLYIGKNILNSFRQDHGYKDGTYIKVWNGKEDNVVMQELLESNPTISPKELYKKLEEAYKKAL